MRKPYKVKKANVIKLQKAIKELKLKENGRH